MRKQKLLLAACALFLGMGVQAQRDITSTYITNATLSDGTNGWTVENFNTPQQGYKTVGYASEAYAGWGSLEKTSYSLTQNITLPAGHYRLCNYSFYREGQAYNTDANTSRAFLKVGEEKVALKTLGSITAAGYANSQAEGANAFDSKMYRNTLDFTVDADNTTLEIGLVGTFEVMRSWCIAGMFELLDLDQEATEDIPLDMTAEIVNAGFEYRNLAGWTVTGGMQAQGNKSFDNTSGGYYCEKWQANGGLPDCSIAQHLTGLPNGKYTLSAYSYFGGTGAYVEANNIRTDVDANASGQYKVTAAVTDGTLDIKAGLENATSNWVCFDRFELVYLGVDLDLYKESVKSLRETAAAITGAMNKDVADALANALSATESVANTRAALEEAISLLNTAITNANNSIAAYAEVKAKIEEAATRTAAALGVPEADYAVYNKVINAIQEGYDNRTLTNDECKAALSTIEDAIITLFKAQMAEGADMTSVVLNAEGKGEGHQKPEGWNCTNSNNFWVNTWSNEGESDGTGMLTPFIENWVNSNEVLGDGRIAHDPITGLHKGIYKVTGFIRVYSESGKDPSGVYLFANAAKKDILANGTTFTYNGMKGVWGVLELTLEVTDEGVLDLGFEIKDATFNWLACKNFTLTYVSAGITEAQAAELIATAPTAAMNVEVKAAMDAAIKALQDNRSFNNYNALVDAITEAKLSVAKYEEAKEVLNAAASLDEVGQNAYAASDVIKELQKLYDRRTLVSVTDEQREAALLALVAAAKSQASNGANMTLAIVNPSFEMGNLTGWTTTTEGDTGVKPNSNNTYKVDNCDGDYLFNTWNGDAVGYDITQVLTDMPAGSYKLTALFAGRIDAEVNLVAGEASTTVKHTATGHGTEAEVEFKLAKAGDVTIGATGANGWYKVDNFRLTYLGADIAPLKTPSIEEVSADGITFNVPTEDVNGNSLVPSQLSFQFFVDDENNALVFKKADYESLEEDMTIIPYNFVDDEYYFNEGMIFFPDGYQEYTAWYRLGLKSYYKDGDNTYESEIFWLQLKTPDSIEAMTNGNGSATYTDLQGRQATATAKGLLIMQVRQADGTVKTQKVVRK